LGLAQLARALLDALFERGVGAEQCLVDAVDLGEPW
jgi:hypothetical protein